MGLGGGLGLMNRRIGCDLRAEIPRLLVFLLVDSGYIIKCSSHIRTLAESFTTYYTLLIRF